MKYAVIIEQGASSYGAYAPDLPGCIAAGETYGEALRLIHEAIELHIQGLKEDGLAAPEPCSSIEIVEVAS